MRLQDKIFILEQDNAKNQQIIKLQKEVAATIMQDERE